MARALASKPKIILADEPTANLDSKSAAKLLDIMAKLNKEEKITFLFSTHDQRVIRKARRVITLVDGKIDSDVAANTYLIIMKRLFLTYLLLFTLTIINAQEKGRNVISIRLY